ncbi:MAG: TatD family hydrolase [Acidimicrobiia bacterium]
MSTGFDAPGALRWCDNHCHLDFDGIDDGAIDAARAAGVQRMITIGTDAAHSARAIEIANANDDVFATVGLHPHDAVNGVADLIPLLQSPKVVAVGEAGLDFYYDHSPRDVQRDAFVAQIMLAKEHDLTLVIHTREAWPETFAIIDEVGLPERTVFHCFTGGADEARRCLDSGAYLSFSGIVTFKAADDVREAAKLCPLDRLLVETDSPYLAPVPHRGKKNQPAFVPYVGAAIAQLQGLTTERVAESSWDAAAVAFRLPPA